MSRFSLRVHVDYVHRILSFTGVRGSGRLFRADLSDESGLPYFIPSSFFFCFIRLRLGSISCIAFNNMADVMSKQLITGKVCPVYCLLQKDHQELPFFRYSS